MSNYPDPNYAAAPDYPSDVGLSCANPKPYWFYDGATFCTDVTINNNLFTVNANVSSSLVTSTLQVKTPAITVGNAVYEETLFINPYDGFYYKVLASLVPTP